MPTAYRTELADEDLRAIAFQIGVESGRPQAADQIIDELLDCCDRLGQLAPSVQAGTLRPDLGAGVRLFAHRRWVVIFRYLDDGALILRIVDGSRDYLSWDFE
jgi:plasmid stabilization system protein ParE